MEQINNIEVKINNHGRYVWKISVNYQTDYKKAIEELKDIDLKLKDAFPDHVLRGNGRVANFEED